MSYCKIMVRTAILLQLRAASPAQMPVKNLLCGLKIASFEIGESELLRELDYLEKKGYIKMGEDEISPSYKRCTLSALAYDYLERRGF